MTRLDMSNYKRGMSHETYPSEERLRAVLLDRAHTFMEITGRKPTEVGKAAMNDPAFLPRLKKGRGFRLSTFSRVMGWLDANWPATSSMRGE